MWLKFIKSFFRPKDVDRGLLTRKRLALAYAIVAWHTLAYGLYLALTDEKCGDNALMLSVLNEAKAKGKQIEYVKFELWKTDDTVDAKDDASNVSQKL